MAEKILTKQQAQAVLGAMNNCANVCWQVKFKLNDGENFTEVHVTSPIVLVKRLIPHGPRTEERYETPEEFLKAYEIK